MCLGCHVVTVGVEVRSLAALEAACARLKWTFHRGRTDHRWYGEWVDDSPVPANLFEDESEYRRVLAMPKEERQTYMKALLGRCDHVISVPGCVYEIGVFKVGDRWELSYDWVGDLHKAIGYPKHVIEKHPHLAGQFPINPLPQAYALEAAIEQARSAGQTVSEHLNEDGSIELRVQVWE